tara:strand:+ start:3163 stop:3465 length:303 start_codon:yes stop_codon:yes gene_type:complete
MNIDFINAGYGSKEIGTEKEKKGFKEIDLNNDGKIDYYEFQQIRQRRFDRLDLNKDKIITQNEFELRNQKFFSEIDENEDKYLTKIEMFKKRKKMRNILE